MTRLWQRYVVINDASTRRVERLENLRSYIGCWPSTTDRPAAEEPDAFAGGVILRTNSMLEVLHLLRVLVPLENSRGIPCCIRRNSTSLESAENTIVLEGPAVAAGR